MHNITAAAPRHFGGQLLRSTVDCQAGLHRMELELLDDDNRVHVVYIAYGRGDDAARYALAQYQRLVIGCWYYGSATLMRNSTGKTEWAGHVPPLQPCQRRHRFVDTQAARVAA